MTDMRSEAIGKIHICDTDGCFQLAPFGQYCRDCQEEIEAFNAWQEQKQIRHARRVKVFRRMATPLLVVVMRSTLALASAAVALNMATLNWIGKKFEIRAELRGSSREECGGRASPGAHRPAAG